MTSRIAFCSPIQLVTSVGLLITSMTVHNAITESRDHYSSFCETETFNATCPSDHVVLITHARYGRMKLSRCVKMDYGHIGCSADVINAADTRCSGRRKCEIRVPDSEFAKNKPCPDDLKPYLEAGFTCVRVQTPTSSCNSAQHNKALAAGVPVTSPYGYLSSLVADSTGCGRSRSPWTITVQRGQTIRLTLHDFGLHARTKSRPAHGGSSGSLPAPTSPACVLYALLREPLSAVRHGGENVSVCGALQRQSVIYTSSTHRLDVTMVHGDQGDHVPHYLLQYAGKRRHIQSIGCPDLVMTSNSWPVRHEDGAIVRCNFTKEVYHLKCAGNTWIGDVANCTVPHLTEPNVEKITNANQSPISYGMSVAIVMVLAFSIGLIVLSVGLLFIKRRHHLCNHHDNADVTGVNNESTRHFHSHQAELYDSFTAKSKCCVTKTLLLGDVRADSRPRTLQRLRNPQPEHLPNNTLSINDLDKSPDRSNQYSPGLPATDAQPSYRFVGDVEMTSRNLRPVHVTSCECCVAEPGTSLRLSSSGSCVLCTQRPSDICRTTDELAVPHHQRQQQQYYVIDRRQLELGSSKQSRDDNILTERRQAYNNKSAITTSSGVSRVILVPTPGELQRTNIDIPINEGGVALKDDIMKVA